MRWSRNEQTQRTPRLDQEFVQASGKWTGCDWVTQFGQTGLNLQGLTSAEATLLAMATCGGERRDWQSAVIWLREVEETIWAAETEARQALALARFGRLEEALLHAQRACALEGKYHDRLVWKPLRDVIEDAQKIVARNKHIV